MESRLPPSDKSSIRFPTYAFPPQPVLRPTVTWPSSSDASSTLVPTALPSASTASSGKTYHFGSDDAPSVNIPADSLPDDHSGSYVPSEEGDESDDSERASQISNSELTDDLPRVTTKEKERQVAAQAKQAVGSGKRKRSPNESRPATAKRLHAEPSPNVVPTTPVHCEQADDVFASRKQKVVRSRSPIFHFFTEIHENHQQHCKDWKEGDKLYRCVHGDNKVLRITPAMRGSINGLKCRLKRDAPLMYNLFEILEKKRGLGVKPTPEELLVASGQRTVDQLPYQLQEQLKQIGDLSETTQSKPEPFDQIEFERLVTEWIVACDQPFDEVEKFEFKQMIHAINPNAVLPSADTVQRRVVDMANEMVTGLKTMISGLDSKVSLSLDCWTSSNQYAFLAIVMHYVNNDWELEEVLIDFQKLVGEHSGANLAAAVWQTVEFYGLAAKILTIVADNATNNDTMMVELEVLFRRSGIPFSAKMSRLRCMPHTIHLSVMKLLDGIGAIPSQSTEPQATPDNYQESVSELITSSPEEQFRVPTTDHVNDGTSAAHILSALDKIRKIVRFVRSSPQRKRTWLNEVSLSLRGTSDACDAIEEPLILILDVKARWSSTYQMLRRALKYKNEISRFLATAFQSELALTATEWISIEIITQWLWLCHQATEQTSATKQVTLSMTHGIFHSLQDHLRRAVANLPVGVPFQLRSALIAAHLKLSEYYAHFDESPFYLWACFLDPRIGYEGLKHQASQELDSYRREDYLKEINDAVESFKQYYLDHYAPPLTTAADGTNTSKPFDFFAIYALSPTTPSTTDELEQYLLMRPQGFAKGTCEPILWWKCNQRLYPNIARLARDILGIPGSAVTVERVLSGGRDIISLRHASLMPSTLQRRMLVKHRLLLSRRQYVRN